MASAWFQDYRCTEVADAHDFVVPVIGEGLRTEMRTAPASPWNPEPRPRPWRVPNPDWTAPPLRCPWCQAPALAHNAPYQMAE